MSEAGAADGFEGLLEYMKHHRGFDFTGYKRESLQRRIHSGHQPVSSSGANGDERGGADDRQVRAVPLG